MTKEAYPYFIYGSNRSLHRRVVFRSCEDVVERRRSDDSGHDSLIISKESEASRRNCRHGQRQRPAREAHVTWRRHPAAPE